MQGVNKGRKPEEIKFSDNSDSAEPENEASYPETADPNTVGLIAALAATVVIGAVALIVMIRRRQLGL